MGMRELWCSVFFFCVCWERGKGGREGRERAIMTSLGETFKNWLGFLFITTVFFIFGVISEMEGGGEKGKERKVYKMILSLSCLVTLYKETL